ncbi:MAG: hypothetical protein QNJ78_08925 [Gammaproteobacteria bacterium]|nr:hypothetical protein [Gammaproteobacteria bacterium]
MNHKTLDYASLFEDDRGTLGERNKRFKEAAEQLGLEGEISASVVEEALRILGDMTPE